MHVFEAAIYLLNEINKVLGFGNLSRFSVRVIVSFSLTEK